MKDRKAETEKFTCLVDWSRFIKDVEKKRIRGGNNGKKICIGLSEYWSHSDVSLALDIKNMYTFYFHSGHVMIHATHTVTSTPAYPFSFHKSKLFIPSLPLSHQAP